MSADLPLGVDEPGEAVEVDIDAALGGGELIVHAEQGRAGPRACRGAS